MTTARETLRAFIADTAAARGGERPVVEDRTPLVDSGLLTSLMVADLLLLLEELRGGPLDLHRLAPGALKDLDTIVTTFLEPTT